VWKETTVELFRGGSLVLATVATGLLAGLFFSFSIAVMPGLSASDDRTYVGAMQSINRSILNGWFALASLAALLLTILALVLHLREDGHKALPWIIVGLVLYVATWIVTMAINVPMNNELSAAGNGDVNQITDLAAVRARFEASLLRWNHVRTFLNLGALAALSWALVQYGRIRSAA
jgi:uncharacterized membrane protein